MNDVLLIKLDDFIKSSGYFNFLMEFINFIDNMRDFHEWNVLFTPNQ